MSVIGLHGYAVNDDDDDFKNVYFVNVGRPSWRTKEGAYQALKRLSDIRKVKSFIWPQRQ